MEFQYRNCARVGGQNTKTCHCAEAEYVIGEGDEAPVGAAMRNWYGEFFRTGAFNVNMQDWNQLNGKTNVTDSTSLFQKFTYSDECTALDGGNNYLWLEPGKIIFKK